MNRRAFIVALTAAAISPALPKSEAKWRVFEKSGSRTFQVYGGNGLPKASVMVYFTDGEQVHAQEFDLKDIVAAGGMAHFRERVATLTDAEIRVIIAGEQNALKDTRGTLHCFFDA